MNGKEKGWEGEGMNEIVRNKKSLGGKARGRGRGRMEAGGESKGSNGT